MKHRERAERLLILLNRNWIGEMKRARANEDDGRRSQYKPSRAIWRDIPTQQIYSYPLFSTVEAVRRF